MRSEDKLMGLVMRDRATTDSLFDEPTDHAISFHVVHTSEDEQIVPADPR